METSWKNGKGCAKHVHLLIILHVGKDSGNVSRKGGVWNRNECGIRIRSSWF